MALQIPDDEYTDHISWKSRGHVDPTEFITAGLTPVTCPGSLEGMAYSKVFRLKYPGLWAVRGVNSDDNGTAAAVQYVVSNLGIRKVEVRNMFSSYRSGSSFLDGGLSFEAHDYGFSGPPMLDLSGTKALRLVCHRLGIVQPRRFAHETEPPDLAAIEREFRNEVLLAALSEPPPAPPARVRPQTTRTICRLVVPNRPPRP
jgi:hypothetical protein